MQVSNVAEWRRSLQMADLGNSNLEICDIGDRRRDRGPQLEWG
jgi:hypothetical protein